LVFTPGLVKNNSHFDTATDTDTDMVIVEHVGGISNFFSLLSVGPDWCIMLIVLTLKDGVTVTR